eukprot:2253905-Amphidinium_carterae.1
MVVNIIVVIIVIIIIIIIIMSATTVYLPIIRDIVVHPHVLLVIAFLIVMAQFLRTNHNTNAAFAVTSKLHSMQMRRIGQH